MNLDVVSMFYFLFIGVCEIKCNQIHASFYGKFFVYFTYNKLNKQKKNEKNDSISTAILSNEFFGVCSNYNLDDFWCRKNTEGGTNRGCYNTRNDRCVFCSSRAGEQALCLPRRRWGPPGRAAAGAAAAASDIHLPPLIRKKFLK